MYVCIYVYIYISMYLHIRVCVFVCVRAPREAPQPPRATGDTSVAMSKMGRRTLFLNNKAYVSEQNVRQQEEYAPTRSAQASCAKPVLASV